MKTASKSKKFLNILKSEDFPIIIVDDNGKITFTNKKAEDLFDLSKEDLKGLMFGIPVIPGKPMEIDIIISGEPKGKVRITCFDLDKDRKSGYIILYTDDDGEIERIRKFLV